jgi:hypothetical protein
MRRHGWPIPGRAGLLVPGDGKALTARRIRVRETHLWRQPLLLDRYSAAVAAALAGANLPGAVIR